MAIQLQIDTSGGANFEGYHLRNVASLHVGGASLAAATLEVTGTLSVSGVATTNGIQGAVSTHTSGYTVTANDETLFVTGTVYLPSAVSGGRVSIKAVGSATIIPQAGQTVEHEGFLTLADGAAVELRADKALNWGIFMAYLPDPDTNQLLLKLLGAILHLTDVTKQINDVTDEQPVLEIRAISSNRGQ